MQMQKKNTEISSVYEFSFKRFKTFKVQKKTLTGYYGKVYLDLF